MLNMAESSRQEVRPSSTSVSESSAYASEGAGYEDPRKDLLVFYSPKQVKHLLEPRSDPIAKLMQLQDEGSDESERNRIQPLEPYSAPVPVSEFTEISRREMLVHVYNSKIPQHIATREKLVVSSGTSALYMNRNASVPSGGFQHHRMHSALDKLATDLRKKIYDIKALTQSQQQEGEQVAHLTSQLQYQLEMLIEISGNEHQMKFEPERLSGLNHCKFYLHLTG